MQNNVAGILSNLITRRSGTPVHVKGDGRIEIPHRIVRLMGWKDKQVITVCCDTCSLVLSESCKNPIGKVSISAGRLRVPMSMLKKAGLNGHLTFVVSTNLNDSSICVMPYVLDKNEKIFDIIGSIDNNILEMIHDILVNPVRLIAVKSVLSKPQLFLPSCDGPTIVRIIGPSLLFNAHWVNLKGDGRGGTIVPHKDGCKICEHRTPDILSIIPVIRKQRGELDVGFLLVKEGLRRKIGSVLLGTKSDPSCADVLIYYVPYDDGMFRVYMNPHEVMPEDIINKAKETCGDPNAFVASCFQEPDEPFQVHMIPVVLAKKHFDSSAGPRNFGK